MPFRITTVQRDIWLGHMRAALATTAISPELEEILLDYLTRAADAMRNTPPDDAPRPSPGKDSSCERVRLELPGLVAQRGGLPDLSALVRRRKR